MIITSAWQGVGWPESTHNVCLINQIQKYSLFTAVQRERYRSRQIIAIVTTIITYSVDITTIIIIFPIIIINTMIRIFLCKRCNFFLSGKVHHKLVSQPQDATKTDPRGSRFFFNIYINNIYIVLSSLLLKMELNIFFSQPHLQWAITIACSGESSCHQWRRPDLRASQV